MNDYKIILDKERTIKYSNRSFIELEKRTGQSIVSIFTEATSEATPELQQRKLVGIFSTSKFINDFIYCGLLHEKINYEDIIDMVSVNKYIEIMTLAFKILPEEYGFTSTAKKETKKKI